MLEKTKKSRGRPRSPYDYTVNRQAIKEKYVTIPHYTKVKGINYAVLQKILTKSGRSQKVEKQLERDGFLTYLKEEV